jgi:hypothetical protein
MAVTPFLGSIHARWAATPALAALLPAARVFTGMSADTTLPFAVLAKESDRPLGRYNDGSSIDAVELRIEVFDASYDSAAAIVAEVLAAFDRAAFALDGDDKVIDSERVGSSEQQKPDGVWQMIVSFVCTVYRAAPKPENS